MNDLLFLFLFAGVIEPKPPTPAVNHGTAAAFAARSSVVIVGDGSGSWSGAEADAIINRLQTRLDASWPLHVVRFDGEGPRDSVLRPDGPSRDLVRVTPHTPMTEAIALSLRHLSRISEMVVIAHAQISPTYLRSEQLMSLLRRSEVRIHTIHLSGQTKRTNLLGRLQRLIISGTVWGIEALIEEDREAYSAKDTARMLNSMADESGGVWCAAPDRKSALLCAETIAAEVTESLNSQVSGPSTADNDPMP